VLRSGERFDVAPGPFDFASADTCSRSPRSKPGTTRVEEGHDLAVRIAHLPDSTLIAQPVGSVRRVVTASPGWLRRHGSPRHPGDLANLNCLIGAEGGRWTFVEGNRCARERSSNS